MTGGLRSVARMSCAEFAGSLDPYVPGDVPSTKNISFMTTIGIIRAVYTTFSSITSSATSSILRVSRGGRSERARWHGTRADGSGQSAECYRVSDEFGHRARIVANIARVDLIVGVARLRCRSRSSRCDGGTDFVEQCLVCCAVGLDGCVCFKPTVELLRELHEQRGCLEPQVGPASLAVGLRLE